MAYHATQHIRPELPLDVGETVGSTVRVRRVYHELAASGPRTFKSTDTVAARVVEFQSPGTYVLRYLEHAQVPVRAAQVRSPETMAHFHNELHSLDCECGACGPITSAAA